MNDMGPDSRSNVTAIESDSPSRRRGIENNLSASIWTHVTQGGDYVYGSKIVRPGGSAWKIFDQSSISQ
jgi:hypothetical protein